MKKIIFAILVVSAAIYIAAKFFMPIEVFACRIVPKEFNQRLVVMGRITPSAEVNLGSTISGRISSVRAEEGDRVEKDAVLLTIEDSELRSNLAVAQAAVSQARAKIEQISGTEGRVAEETLNEKKHQLENAVENFERSKKLFDSQALSKSELSAAELALKSAQSSYDIASAREKSIAKGGNDFNLSKTALSQAMANAELFRDKLAGAKITAPFSGVILQKKAEKGGVVQPGATLFVLARTDEIFITTDIEEKNLSLIHEGQKAMASAEAYPGQKFETIVFYISKSVDPSRGTVKVKLKIPNPPNYLKTDMTVSIDLDVATSKNVVMIPSAALDEQTELFVFTVEKGVVVKKNVKPGLRDNANIQILEGLKPGDIIVLPKTGKKIESIEIAECR